MVIDILVVCVSGLVGYGIRYMQHSCPPPQPHFAHTQPILPETALNPASPHRVLTVFKFADGQTNQKYLFEHSIKDPILWKTKKFSLVSRDEHAALFQEIEGTR
jgi:hypothetical protein